jgi:hypothetical protein
LKIFYKALLSNSAVQCKNSTIFSIFYKIL